MTIQQKTGVPVQFEITEQTRKSIEVWYAKAQLQFDDYLFPSRNSKSPHFHRLNYCIHGLNGM